MVPSGWEVKKLEDLCAPDAPITYGVLKPGEYCSNGIPLLQIKDLSDGQVSSKDLHLISKELDEEYKRSRILKNDILISLVGTIGRVAKFELSIPANIHRNLGRVRTDYHEFIFHFLNSDVALKLMGDSSSGSSQSALNLSTLRAMKVPFPPVKEQQKISKILSTWDQAISATEKLLENSQKQKNALMQQLLTGKKRLLDESGVRFSEEWQRIELGLLLDYQQPTPYLVESTAYSDSYKTPVLTAGKTFILGYTNESSGIYQDQLPVIIFDDFTTDSKYVNFPFKAKSSAMKILTAKKGVSIKFVFEAMQMLQFNVGGHQRHWISIFSNLVIPLPNLKEQQKIAEILSLADQEIETLQKKLNCLKQEKKALMQQLLIGKKRVKVAA
ncbi:restriction endonuclease subunit S [Acinetobacter indicus]|uniref:restriction endonuclease subunit S n=2 Tax=Moraxellaceae TaxID=468 RepID=UPI0015D1754D|nr:MULTISPECIES: restriction endonuclease subunit S [Acinetobacter]MCP0915269.1 restriction endonuclease subunit S [Acinetobacter indicus]MCP0918394.1 restriction endonuclease subunit S [Acinetobacter indicus]MCP0921060.1 restriction endonuclease subunit S [Acinetobacter indicus]